MLAEAEQVEPSNTCPLIVWEALESIDDDVDENSHGSASNNDIQRPPKKYVNLFSIVIAVTLTINMKFYSS